MARMPVRRLYIEQLRTAMAKLFPERLWSLIEVHGNSKWTPARLLAALVVMSWDEAPTLAARFDKARDLLQRWLPEMVRRVRERLQERSRASCEESWKTGHWVVFAVDGSRFERPRTAANEKVLECAGKERTAPQIFNTLLIHLAIARRNATRLLASSPPSHCLPPMPQAP